MRRLSRLLAIGVAVVVTVAAVPGSAYAVGDQSRTLWKNYSNNLCMGVAGGNSKVQDGAAIITWTCDGTANQTWVLSAQSNGTYLIENSVATSECLSVAAKSLSVGASVVLWHCKAASDNQDQEWYLPTDRSAPYNYLWNFNSNLVATAEFTVNGAAVIQAPQGNTWFPLDAWVASCLSSC